ncbi:DUF4157 domain-containing protein [Aquiflexum sp.]|uniref:eCIS core domain-containing protein n=1 Tax=Aquiflexum sp. TaxID=1872584 RepID=UPI003593BF59
MKKVQEKSKSPLRSNDLGSGSFFSPTSDQSKLKVNHSTDNYEKEADQVADKVVQGLASLSQETFSAIKTENNNQNQSKNNQLSAHRPSLNQTKCDTCEMENKELGDKEKILRKPLPQIFLKAADNAKNLGTSPMSRRKNSDSTAASLNINTPLFSSKGNGVPLSKNIRSEMEQGFGVDFSNVRIHADPTAANMSKHLGAKAFTHGSDIYFNSGKFDSQSQDGKKLLAHELTHVVQQSGMPTGKIMRKVDEASVEAEYNTWADDNKQPKDKTHADFPWAVWDFIRPQIVDMAMEPLPKPPASDKAALEKWNDNFSKAEIISRWLFTLKSTTKDVDLQKEADSKGFYILDSLAKAGFVSKAIAQSGYLEPSNRTLVYDTILKNPSLVSASEFETIVTFQCNGVADPASVPIVQTFTDKNDSLLKKLNADQTKAIFKVLVTKYGSHDTIIDAIAEVLMFNPSIRNSVSDALMSGTIGTPDIMFKVLKHKYFIEPKYGATLLGALKPAGMTSEDYDEKRMKDDMPWVYTYKQKYYVQFLIDLANDQGIKIPAPKTMTFTGLKAWLETNTENIGNAANKKYPSDPESIFEIYKNIADIFFYHVPHDRDAVPHLEGKISHLKEGEPSKKRFEADCDVFATYAMRLFSNAGFDPIGYIAFVPEGADAHRAAHVAALIRKDGKYSIINNKGILDTGISESSADEKKTDAMKKLRKLAFEDTYGRPFPTELKIYYADSEAKGKMPQLFRNQDSSLERTDL